MNIVQKAMELSREIHKGQVRKLTKQPFFVHTYRVYKCVSEETDNPDLLCAALLHDSIEDTKIRRIDLTLGFNPVVATIVSELTNVYTKENYPIMCRTERKQLECKRISHMSFSAKLIKLADRIDNLIDFKLHDPEYQALWKQGQGNDFYYIKEGRLLLESLREVSPRLEKLYEDLV